jgi:hypothetical protein
MNGSEMCSRRHQRDIEGLNWSGDKEETGMR